MGGNGDGGREGEGKGGRKEGKGKAGDGKGRETGGKFKMRENPLAAGAPSGPHWGSLQRSPNL